LKSCKYCRTKISKISKGKSNRKQRDDTEFCSRTCWSRYHRSTLLGWARNTLSRAKSRSKIKKIEKEFDLTEEFILNLYEQ
jgi:hypothetical protein